MTNHLHLLRTPLMSNSMSLMMQSLGRQYVRYFNGCYKSCLVQAEDYLLQLYRYIGLNPVRANTIEDPADYYWLSYQIKGLGKKSELSTPHPIFMVLQCQAAYGCLFSSHVEGTLLEAIRVNSNKGMTIGNEQFKQEIETLTGRRKKIKNGSPSQPTEKKEAIWGVGVKLTLTPVYSTSPGFICL
jgi:putative transposase